MLSFSRTKIVLQRSTDDERQQHLARADHPSCYQDQASVSRSRIAPPQNGECSCASTKFWEDTNARGQDNQNPRPNQTTRRDLFIIVGDDDRSEKGSDKHSDEHSPADPTTASIMIEPDQGAEKHSQDRQDDHPRYQIAIINVSANHEYRRH